MNNDFILEYKLNDKYKFYNIIIFDPESCKILFDNNDKYLFSLNDINQYTIIRNYNFGIEIKYYKKDLSQCFFKGVYQPFVATNLNYSNAFFTYQNPVLYIPSSIVDFQQLENTIENDEDDLNYKILNNIKMSFYINDDEEKTTHTIKNRLSNNILTESGEHVKKISEYLQKKYQIYTNSKVIYNLLRSLSDEEISKDIAVLTRDIKLKEILK
jgi:superfamily II helicase